MSGIFVIIFTFIFILIACVCFRLIDRMLIILFKLNNILFDASAIQNSKLKFQKFIILVREGHEKQFYVSK